MGFLVLLSGCGLKLTRGSAGWAVEEKQFTVEPVKDGRLMGDGWLLQNYEKKSKGEYQQKRPADLCLTFSRSDDDGLLAVDELDTESKKSLRTLAERLVRDLRTQQIEVSAGRYTAYVQVDEPVAELAAAEVPGEEIEGYEIVVAQRHQGEPKAWRHVYIGLVRAKSSPTVITVLYVNSPAAFASGVQDARALTRRVKLGAASLAAELPKLDAEGAEKPGAPIRL